MNTQTYFHTRLEHEADRRNHKAALQVNCVGMVASSDFYCKSVRKDFYYIYVVKGKMVMKEQTVNAGEVLIYEPGYAYEYHNEGETIYYWVHYTGFRSSGLTAATIGTPNKKIQIGIHKEIIQCFRKMFQEFIIHDALAENVSNCLLEEILLLTARYAGQKKNQTAPIQALEYIHGHFREKIDVDALAKLEHMSATSFRIVFREHTGLSPNEYIIAQRISYACRLIAQINLNISEIAGESGYRDQYYFSRLFKNRMGMSPSRYRKQSRT